MVARIASAPILVSTHTLTDLRSRQVTGERSLVEDGVPPASSNSQAGGGFPHPDQQPQPERPAPALDVLPPGATFAAAVIAGRLSPRPESLEEVYARIGSAWVPPESELRLRDLAV